MSPRRRHPRNQGLPDGLRVRAGYYSYVHPLDGREKGLGRDSRYAIQWARQANAIIEANLVKLKPEDWLEGRAESLPVDPRPYNPDKLLTIDQIRQLPKVSVEAGLYFLLNDGALQYVGISRRIFIRLANHSTTGRIAFDESRCIEIPEAGWRDTLELLYIKKYKPAFNIKHNEPAAPAFASETQQ